MIFNFVYYYSAVDCVEEDGHQIRAPRDAREMRVPLYWCQASDDIKGLAHQAAQIRDKVVKGLRKCYNYNETAHLQSILPLHTGQRVRLTEKASPADDLVQEAEGTVIHVVCDPQESAKLQEQQLVLQYVPLGAWVLMDKCTSAPLSAQSRALFDADFDKSIWVHTHTGDPETHAPAPPHQQDFPNAWFLSKPSSEPSSAASATSPGQSRGVKFLWPAPWTVPCNPRRASRLAKA